MRLVDFTSPPAEPEPEPSTIKLVKPVVPAQETKKGRKAIPKAEGLSLPEGPEGPITSLSQATLLLYGETKVGKTSFASCFEDPFFLFFEPGGSGLTVARRQVGSWVDFVGYIDLILESKRFKTLVIDPVAEAYTMCVNYILEKEDVDDPGDVDWGKGWKAINDEFRKQISRVSSTNRGVVFIGHHDSLTFQKRSGGEYNRIVPRMGKQARNFIEAWVDITAFYGYYREDRFITISGSDELDAGTRLDGNFRTPEGVRIHSIPAGTSQQEAYDNFVTAFNNEQEDRHQPVFKVTFDVPAPPKKKRGA